MPEGGKAGYMGTTVGVKCKAKANESPTGITIIAKGASADAGGTGTQDAE